MEFGEQSTVRRVLAHDTDNPSGSKTAVQSE
jgi:hypothetical protein